MRVNRIALNGFRNYDFETADFSPGTNVIYGENAQGKTNLLEAVYILAAGKSFRTRFFTLSASRLALRKALVSRSNSNEALRARIPAALLPRSL